MSFKNKMVKFWAETGTILLAFLSLFALGIFISLCIVGGIMSIWGMVTKSFPILFTDAWKLELVFAIVFATIYIIISLIKALIQFKKRDNSIKEMQEKNK